MVKKKQDDKPKILLTKRAIEQFKVAIKRELQPKGAGIRIKLIEMSGGFRYDMLFEQKENPDDYVSTQGGLKIFVSEKDLRYLEGYQVDFLSTEQGAGFLFEKKS